MLEILNFGQESIHDKKNKCYNDIKLSKSFMNLFDPAFLILNSFVKHCMSFYEYIWAKCLQIFIFLVSLVTLYQ